MKTNSDTTTRITRIGFAAIIALACLLLIRATDVLAGVALFANPTDTISVSGSLLLTNAATYEARVFFTQPVTNFVGGVFNEWTDNQEDKDLFFYPGILGGFSFPVNEADGDIESTNLTFKLNQWHHVAYVYDGAQERLYLDGALVGSRPASGSIGNAGGIPVVGASPRLEPYSGPRPSFLGYIDTLRISDVARYSGTNFSPPTGKLAADGATLLLFNFNEAPGSTTTEDLSGNGHTGTLGVGFAGSTSPQFTLDPAPPYLNITSAGQLVLGAPIGSTNCIQYVFDLTVTNWQTLTNLVVEQSPLEITDPQFGQVPQKFYRAVRLQ